MVAPIAKKTPWENAVMKRATINNSKEFDKAATMFPTIKTNINIINKDFLLIRFVRAVKIGAPTATPIA